MKKIALEYTDTAEIEAKREEALAEERRNFWDAYAPLEHEFNEIYLKFNISTNYIDFNFGNPKFVLKYDAADEYNFLNTYGPDGILYKVSKKKTKKYSHGIDEYGEGCIITYGYVEPEAHEWYEALKDEDARRFKNFLKRKNVKCILDKVKKLNDENAEHIATIRAHYDAMIEKAQQIQKIGADYKDVYEFVDAVKEEALKIGYYAILKNQSIEFHKITGLNCMAKAITAYATLPYSKKKAKDCIIFNHELFEQVMQPLHDALKVDISWEDKYKEVFYFNKMKTKVKVHVSVGDGRYYNHAAKEFSNAEFTEVNFKKWLKKAEISEYRHLTKEFLKKARSI